MDDTSQQQENPPSVTILLPDGSTEIQQIEQIKDSIDDADSKFEDRVSFVDVHNSNLKPLSKGNEDVQQQEVPLTNGIHTEHVCMMMENLNKCADVMRFEPIICRTFMNILKQDSPVLHLEDALLSVASSYSAGGVFYACAMKNDTHIMARYFEYGAFEGFFKEKVHTKLMEDNVPEMIFPWSAYAKLDVNKNRQFNITKGKGDGEVTHTYRRNMFENKKSVSKMVPAVVDLFAQSDDTKLLCLIVCIFCKKDQLRVNLNLEFANTERRFYHSSGITNHDWCSDMANFWLSDFNKVSVPPLTELITPIGDAPFMKRAFYLSSLPNLHHWRWTDKPGPVDCRHSQRFALPSSRVPGSPRNRIIGAYLHRRDDKETVILNCIHRILCSIDKTTGPEKVLKKKNDNNDNMKRKNGNTDNKNITPRKKLTMYNGTPCSGIKQEVFNKEFFKEFDTLDAQYSSPMMCNKPVILPPGATVVPHTNFTASFTNNSSEKTSFTSNFSHNSSELSQPTVPLNFTPNSSGCTSFTPNITPNSSEQTGFTPNVAPINSEHTQPTDVYHQPVENSQLDSIEDRVSRIEDQKSQLAGILSSQFISFCEQVFRRGVLCWRVLSDGEEVVVCNDYDITGKMKSKTSKKDSHFTHTTLTRTDGEHHIRCDCTSYKSLESLDGVTCLHCRLLREVSVDHIQSSYIKPQVISTGRSCASTKVLYLSSEPNIERWSVVAHHPSVVCEFKLVKSGVTIVSCLSAKCSQHRHGNKHLLKHLSSIPDLCAHLVEFGKFRNVAKVEVYDGREEERCEGKEMCGDMFDCVNGVWSAHRNTPSATVRVKRWSQVAQPMSVYVQRRTKISLLDETTWPTFMPDTEGKCKCSVEWTRSELSLRGTTSLYLQHCVITPKVYSRRCENRVCVKDWTGTREYIYRLSRQICAGWELGERFIDNHVTSNQTFGGFVYCMNRDYERAGDSGRFMSTQTFRDWWLAWACALETS